MRPLLIRDPITIRQSIPSQNKRHQVQIKNHYLFGFFARFLSAVKNSYNSDYLTHDLICIVVYYATDYKSQEKEGMINTSYLIKSRSIQTCKLTTLALSNKICLTKCRMKIIAHFKTICKNYIRPY